MVVPPIAPAHSAGTAAIVRAAPATSAPIDDAPQTGPDSASPGPGPGRIALSTQAYELPATGTQPSIPISIHPHSSDATCTAASQPRWVDHGST
jgi:hypothetical protein